MCGIGPLIRNNRAWSARRRAEDPQFFTRLAGQLEDGLLHRVGDAVGGFESRDAG
jgi:hypothetical protein